MNKKELSNREKLRQKKPKVLDKILKDDSLPRIQFQRRYTCNMACKHCSIATVADKNREELSIEDIKTLFDAADRMGISRMTLTGGEPLVFKDLEEVIKAIDPSRFFIQLDTNGYLLDSVEKVKWLQDLGVDCIAPSLDSLDFDSHDDFRNKPGSGEKALKSFDYIQAIDDMGTFVQTVVTKSRLYSKEFLAFIDYFNKRDIGVFVSFAKPVGTYSNCFDDLIETKDLKYMEELESKHKVFTHLTPAYGRNTERHCVASKNIFAITAYGDVLPCIYFYCSMGNIREESLETILDRCVKLKPFQKATCVIADKSDTFIDKYLVKGIYGKKLPVDYKEVFTEEDFDENI